MKPMGLIVDIAGISSCSSSQTIDFLFLGAGTPVFWRCVECGLKTVCSVLHQPTVRISSCRSSQTIDFMFLRLLKTGLVEHKISQQSV